MKNIKNAIITLFAIAVSLSSAMAKDSIEHTLAYHQVMTTDSLASENRTVAQLFKEAGAAYEQNQQNTPQQTNTQVEEEPEVDLSHLSKKEQKALKKEQKKKERAQREKERLEGKKSFEEFLARWQPFIPCGDPDIDLFCASAGDMVLRFKKFRDSMNFIRIETFTIPDAGDGVTQIVKITDGNGHERTKESVSKKWTQLSLEIGLMAVDLTAMGITGASMISKFIEDPSMLLNFRVIGQIRRSIQAINMLTIEIRRAVPIIKEQRALLESIKSN